MKKLILPSIILLLAFACPEKKKITIWLCGDSTMSIKETKAFPETGWGMPFVYFWDSSVTVINKAKNGRSTSSFRNEGLWKQVMDGVQEGDYIFIQFGHNDEVPTKKTYTTATEFRNNLKQYIAEARAKKANPVLLTLFDMDKKTQALYQQYGVEPSRLLFLQLKPGEHPNYPEGKEDNTHFSELGARLLAQMVLQEIREQVPELSQRIYTPVKK
jgi:lysophospholipase L1-like esterase